MIHHSFMLRTWPRSATPFFGTRFSSLYRGNAVAFGLNLLEFRRQSLLLQCAAAAAVSCTLAPVLAYVLWTMFSVDGAPMGVD
jgi:hypothetical protein